MHKILKRVILGALSLVLVAGVGAGLAIGWGHIYRTTYQWDAPDHIVRKDTGEDIRTIIADGDALYDEEGNLFQIKGVNFGNLFISEGWMTVNSIGPLLNEDGSFTKVNEEAPCFSVFAGSRAYASTSDTRRQGRIFKCSRAMGSNSSISRRLSCGIRTVFAPAL